MKRIKELNDMFKKQNLTMKILNLVSKEPLNVSQLSKRLNLNRSTLRYYINLLRAEGKIKIEKNEEEIGRPVYIKINKEYFNKELQSELKGAREDMKKIFSSPSFRFILEILDNNEEITEEQLFEIISKEEKKLFEGKNTISQEELDDGISFVSAISNINLLKTLKLIEKKYSINKNGKEFLKELKDLKGLTGTQKEKKLEKWLDNIFHKKE
jgi:predicted transcriptional regulator